MVIFHGYVSLPEGKLNESESVDFQNQKSQVSRIQKGTRSSTSADLASSGLSTSSALVRKSCHLQSSIFRYGIWPNEAPRTFAEKLCKASCPRKRNACPGPPLWSSQKKAKQEESKDKEDLRLFIKGSNWRAASRRPWQPGWEGLAWDWDPDPSRSQDRWCHGPDLQGQRHFGGEKDICLAIRKLERSPSHWPSSPGHWKQKRQREEHGRESHRLQKWIKMGAQLS